MEDKIIRGSHRGLTFSFPDVGKLRVGNRFDYLIEKESKSIRIIPAEDGAHTVSRKRSGDTWKALIDLRNKEVQEAIANMDSLRISFTETEVVVSDGSTATVGKKAGKATILRFPRVVLRRMRMAAGMDDISATNAVLDGVQLTLDDLMGSTNSSWAPDIPTIQKDLADVYTVVSLFSGAGILDWPFFMDSRFQIQYAIDYDAAACQTYRQNIGMHIIHGDVHRAFTGSGYPLDAMVHDPDIVIGGPSCKPFSNANRHTRLTDHPDSDLVVQYLRIVETLRPKVWAMENVPAVLTACDGAYFNAIREMGERAGYIIEARVVQDNKVGGFTTRRRAVVIGSRVGKVKFSDLALVSGGKTAGDALRKINSTWSNLNDVTLPGEDTRFRMSFVPQGGNWESIPEQYRTPGKNRHSCTYRRLAWNEASPTIVNWRKPPLIHPTENRTLTVAEAKALQGLPGNFRICGGLGQMQQQVGNSVPVALGEYIKNSLLATMRSEKDGRL